MVYWENKLVDLQKTRFFMEDKQAYHKGIGRDVLIAAIANIIRNLRNVILIPLITGSLSIAHYGE